MSETKAIHVVIRGRVQGVFYRKWTQARARHHGVAGWVRNRADGAVEGVFSGSADAVDALVAECRDGPPAARVDGIDITAAEPVSTRGFAVAD
ncbi:acylphosphatase [Methylobacterium haplocladii]|uniref:acylphosphatase n=1 Tax=Methylobacterium haplocladii TaxID=1176176 RepID=A0A512IKP2_9HYPH|nr:acylphosphatase [Methylobacterium haplocladii]GEO98293.1 acylphosphatase [Methylobacterium haplocladii]GJD84313.1 Acylphosphatase [Methylobacterium haplocladii]GLS58413.1 acylphosphatase [Methylobacterium haplocladii]